MAHNEEIQAALREQFPLYHPFHITLQIDGDFVKFVQNQTNNGDLTPVYLCPNRGLLSAKQVKEWRSINALTAMNLELFYEMLIHSEAMSIYDDGEDIEEFVINAREFITRRTLSEKYGKKAIKDFFGYMNFIPLGQCRITGEEKWHLFSELGQMKKLNWCAEIVIRYI